MRRNEWRIMVDRRRQNGRHDARKERGSWRANGGDGRNGRNDRWDDWVIKVIIKVARVLAWHCWNRWNGAAKSRREHWGVFNLPFGPGKSRDKRLIECHIPGEVGHLGHGIMALPGMVIRRIAKEDALQCLRLERSALISLHMYPHTTPKDTHVSH